MGNFKVSLIKYDDTDELVGSLKKVMESYDMYIAGKEGNKYIFDRDGSFSRSFIINTAQGGFIEFYDEDEVQAESMAQELSEMLSCFVICIGTKKELLFYNAYDSGVNTDQYLSNFDYYEYELDDDTIERYKGNPEAFGDIIDDDGRQTLMETLDACREGSLEAEEGFEKIKLILGAEEEKVDLDEKTDDDLDESIDINDIFYVDFKSINVRTDNKQDVTAAIEKIAGGMGYSKVEDFKDTSSENKGFFKKMFSSMKETKRMSFYVSPVSNGWVTLVGEVETLYGSEPTEWEFLHVEAELSQIINKDVIGIYSSSENWGYSIFKDGMDVYSFSSDDYVEGADCDATIIEGIDKEELQGILMSPVNNVEDIDTVLNEFCDLLKISNYKINIPMDFTEEEFYSDVLGRLPDGEGFTSLKFVQSK